MSRIRYYSQCFIRSMDAGVKPQTDFEIIMDRLGAKPIGLTYRVVKSRWKYRIYNLINWILSWLLMPKKQIVVFQYPDQRGLSSIYRRAKKCGNKTIIIVHDLDEIRTGVKDELSYILETSEMIILHTPKMEEWVKNRYSIKGYVIILNMFDYILPLDKKICHCLSRINSRKKIAFCGNLTKARFIERLKLPDNIELILYGPNCTEKMLHQKGVAYRGSVLPEELPYLIKDCDYGLVWDGEDINECSGLRGQYLKYNAPYKLSLYLSAGLPVIIWEEMGVKDYLDKLGVALSCKSLTDLGKCIGAINDEEYYNLRMSAGKIKNYIIEGNSGLNALKKAIQLIDKSR